MFFLFENNFQHCRTKQCETCRHHLNTTSDQTKAKEKQRKKDNIFHKKHIKYIHNPTAKEKKRRIIFSHKASYVHTPYNKKTNI